MKVLLGIGIATGLALFYGYWCSKNYAYANIRLAFKSSGLLTEQGVLRDAEVYFYKSDGSVLAEGVRDDRYNFVHLVHPLTGSCREVEEKAPFSSESRKQWRKCSKNKSAWLSTWIESVDHVQVTYADCLTQKIQVVVDKNAANWFVWWLPHPHFSGELYSSYSVDILVDKGICI
ncbi:MAG: hypothetical protein ACRBHB_08945 [Arenicella sp.]